MAKSRKEERYEIGADPGEGSVDVSVNQVVEVPVILSEDESVPEKPRRLIETNHLFMFLTQTASIVAVMRKYSPAFVQVRAEKAAALLGSVSRHDGIHLSDLSEAERNELSRTILREFQIPEDQQQAFIAQTFKTAHAFVGLCEMIEKYTPKQ